MPWWIVAVFAGALVASLLMMPKPKVEHAKAKSFDDMQFPRATEGDPIPLLLGRRLVKGPNTIWAGDFKDSPIKKKQKTGLFSSKKVTVGHEYYVGLDLALCIGGNDAGVTLHAIYCDKDEVWSGNASTDGATVSINKPNLFGGKESGGGLIATCRYYTGSFSQGINSYVAGFLGAGKATAYRGTAHIVMEAANIGESPQLRTLHFECSRYTNNLGIPSGKHRIGDDLNPLEILYTIYTNGWGGADVDPARINKASWIAAAERLYDEGNGASVLISSPNEAKEVTSEVMAQIDALFYEDPITKEFHIRLVRNDYDIDDLPVFDESNIVNISAFTSKNWSDTTNNVIVKYTNAEKKYSEAIATAQDLANINAQGQIRTSERSYPWVSNGELASKLASRDLSQESVPTFSASIEMNREGQSLKPGDVFILRWGEYKIRRAVMRVKSVDLGALNDNKLSFEVAQDSYALGLMLFGAPESDGSGVIKPTTEATDVPEKMAHEGAYFFAQQSGMEVPANQGIIVYAAKPSAGAVNFDIWASNDTVNYDESEQYAEFTATGSLAGAITASASLATGVISSITVTNVTEALESYTADQNAEGYGMFYIGAELFTYEGASNSGGTWTLTNVRRALLDTVPQAHNIGDTVWFMDGNNIVEDTFGWDDTIRVKALPRTFVDVLALDDASYATVNMLRRAYRPLRPAKVQFAGTSNPFVPPSNGVGSKTITWVNRSRLSTSLYGLAANDNSWEDGQQTVIRYKVTVGGAWQTILVPPGVTTVSFDAGATSGQTVYYEVYSTRDGLDSFSKWEFTSGASSATGTNPDAGGSDPADDNDEYSPPPSAASVVAMTSEAIPANRLVNIYNDAGVAKARLASATNKRPAHGFTREAYESGVQAVIYMDGVNENFAGMTAGQQYLSDNGAVVATPVTGAGKLSQAVGVAASATVFSFEPNESVELK